MELLTSTIKRSLFSQGLVALALLLLLLGNNLYLLPQRVKAISYTLLREIAKQQFLYSTRHLEQMESDHFLIRFYPKDREIAKIVLQNAEDIYQPAQDKLGISHDKKVPVIIYPTREDLGRSFGWAADESAMGVYWAGAIRILSPQEWIDATEPEEVAALFAANGPMAHEFSHLLLDYYTKGNYPRWFTEGVAQYVEWQLTGFKFSSGSKKLGQYWYPLSRMDKNFDDLPDQSLAYEESLAAVRYLVAEHGSDALSDLFQHLKEGYTLDQSMEAVLGYDLKGFEEKLKFWVQEN